MGWAGLPRWEGSILIMGLCGSAIIPIIYGYFADLYNPRSAYWVLLPCYIFLVYYAYYGYRIKHWSLKKSGISNQ